MQYLKNFFFPARSTGTFYNFSVKCKRCGEIIPGQVNVNNEPSLEIDDNGKSDYICRKVLMGNGHCFQQIEVQFTFDENRKVIGKKISDGAFVEN